MGQLDNYNLAELGTFIGIIGSVITGILFATQRSKCRKCCWGCIERDVNAVIKEEKIQMTGHSGDTPRVPDRDNIELKVVDKNTEILSNKNKNGK